MKWFFGLTLAATAAFSMSAIAAPQHQRVRGTVAAVNSTTLTVLTRNGKDVPVTLTSNTKYLNVEKSSLDDVAKGSFIGTATKTVGSQQVALEVVVFPPSMNGTGEGHYGWDRISDTTKAGGGMTESAMTNGTVAAAGNAPTVNSTMTNGTVSTASSHGGGKQIIVTYKGGKQAILVPPTAPIVTFSPGSMSEVTKGATVFVSGTEQGGHVTAGAVAVGTDDVKPPM